MLREVQLTRRFNVSGVAEAGAFSHQVHAPVSGAFEVLVRDGQAAARIGQDVLRVARHAAEHEEGASVFIDGEADDAPPWETGIPALPRNEVGKCGGQKGSVCVVATRKGEAIHATKLIHTYQVKFFWRL